MKPAKNILFFFLILITLLVFLYFLTSKNNQTKNTQSTDSTSAKIEKRFLILKIIPPKVEIPKYESKEQIIRHTYFTLCYDEQHEQPKWVAYKITSRMLKGSVTVPAKLCLVGLVQRSFASFPLQKIQ